MGQHGAAISRFPGHSRTFGGARWLAELAGLSALIASALLFLPHSNSAAARDSGSEGVLRRLLLALPSPESEGGPAARAPAFAVPVGGDRLSLNATLAAGEDIAGALIRAGVGEAEAAAVRDLIAHKVPKAKIEPGTSLDLVLQPRKMPDQPRMFGSLKLRAGIDLDIAVERRGGQFVIAAVPVTVDSTPLRIRGQVGENFTRSALEAGAPPPIVQQYLQALDANSPFAGDLRPDDTFDIVVSHKRGANGERQAGDLLLARLERGGRTMIELLNWDGAGGFVSASRLAGLPAHGGGMKWPVNGRVTSPFGMRLHPVLGYERMHSGMDMAAPWGTPIRAVRSGTVSYAGWNGGHGEYVVVKHDGGLASGYGHMSRIAVHAGTSVSAGEIIGYVGATGLATGPHLHFELFRGGRAVNPAELGRATVPKPAAGQDWAAFRAQVARLKQLVPGGGTQNL